MATYFKETLSNHELSILSSIVQVGDSAYKELMDNQESMFGHPYLYDVRGRIRTKLVQMQCEIESHDSGFPFSFAQRKFSYKHIIPELRTDNIIIHIARSNSPTSLSYKSKYKEDLSYNNEPLCRQLGMCLDKVPPYRPDPYYGLLTFGGKEQTFSVIQFPSPGYGYIVESITIPQVIISESSDDTEIFERKKAKLKKEFLAHEVNII